MINWPLPTSDKQLRGFLGLIGFYRHFIKNYASISFALTELLKRDAFQRNSIAQLTFEEFRKAMIHAPVLALPDFTREFTIQIDASEMGIAVVLTQKNSSTLYVCLAKKKIPILLNSSMHVRELHAITSAVQKWQCYLLGKQFIIETYQRSLKN